MLQLHNQPPGLHRGHEHDERPPGDRAKGSIKGHKAIANFQVAPGAFCFEL